MGQWKRRIPFKVDIAGIIEIMGSSLYSRATTPIRELIQNAHDGIMRRRSRELSYKGRIDIRQDAASHTLTFVDDGIGLSTEEAERYLGTLGIGITGMIKRSGGASAGEGGLLIGQFGIGLFSAFMLADRMVVESKRLDNDEPVRWEAGAGTEIELGSSERAHTGTSVTLHLKPQYYGLAEQQAMLEEAVKEYADFLPVPIFINDGAARANLINAAWFDPTPEREAIELELEQFFQESALDVIPIRTERPAAIAGALYVTPQRTPGFSGEAVVTVTIRRMVISRRIQGLLPEWTSFLRGVLELNGCAPTASREDLVRDEAFVRTRSALEELVFRHFEELARSEAGRMHSIIAWHRYTFAGASITNARLRALMRSVYLFPTSQGTLTFDQVLERSSADPLFESEAEHVIWFNSDRRQERYINTLFAGNDAPCVHALRSFEEALLAAMAADAGEGGKPTALRPASPGSPSFAQSILNISDMEEASADWQDFLGTAGARVFLASFDEKTPVLAFLNERHELMQTFEELKKSGEIPAGFQRLIDTHFEKDRPRQNEVLLNRAHVLVSRALAQKSSHPLASVLRLLVFNALANAGAAVSVQTRNLQAEDLDWIAEVLWKRGT